jgi:hypothetical protein
MTHRLVVINAHERHSDTILDVGKRNEAATCRVAGADADCVAFGSTFAPTARKALEGDARDVLRYG